MPENYNTNHVTLKQFSEDDRPREKFALKGKASLSNAELLAILIGSGTQKQTAIELCQSILKSCDNKLTILRKKSINQLTEFHGVGPAKAITILAALELTKRIDQGADQQRIQITQSGDAYRAIRGHLQGLSIEEFWILLLDRSNKVINKVQISIGGVSGTVVDPKIVYKRALEQYAVSIILAHNHPSGNLTPSQADLKLTEKLKNAGKFLDLQVLDHLIVTDSGYYSFADEGTF